MSSLSDGEADMVVGTSSPVSPFENENAIESGRREFRFPETAWQQIRGFRSRRVQTGRKLRLRIKKRE